MVGQVWMVRSPVRSQEPGGRCHRICRECTKCAQVLRNNANRITCTGLLQPYRLHRVLPQTRNGLGTMAGNPPSEQEMEELQAKLLEQQKAAMIAQMRAVVEAEIRAMDAYEREHGESSPSGPGSSLLPCWSLACCLNVPCVVAGSVVAFFHLAREVFGYYYSRSRSRPAHEKTA